jgi:hypothetical protein
MIEKKKIFFLHNVFIIKTIYMLKYKLFSPHSLSSGCWKNCSQVTKILWHK